MDGQLSDTGATFITLLSIFVAFVFGTTMGWKPPAVTAFAALVCLYMSGMLAILQAVQGMAK